MDMDCPHPNSASLHPPTGSPASQTPSPAPTVLSRTDSLGPPPTLFEPEEDLPPAYTFAADAQAGEVSLDAGPRRPRRLRFLSSERPSEARRRNGQGRTGPYPVTDSDSTHPTACSATTHRFAHVDLPDNMFLNPFPTASGLPRPRAFRARSSSNPHPPKPSWYRSDATVEQTSSTSSSRRLTDRLAAVELPDNLFETPFLSSVGLPSSQSRPRPSFNPQTPSNSRPDAFDQRTPPSANRLFDRLAAVELPDNLFETPFLSRVGVPTSQSHDAPRSPDTPLVRYQSQDSSSSSSSRSAQDRFVSVDPPHQMFLTPSPTAPRSVAWSQRR